MNYLGLIGLLGLTGERGGAAGAGRRPDRRPRRRRADGGLRDPGRAARARRRRRPTGLGRGQLVDVSMADGALSWLAMVAGALLRRRRVPRRGELPLAGSLICYRPYECADGWVTLGALEPKFWQACCRGVGREDLIEQQFERPGSDAHGAGRARSSSAARAPSGSSSRPSTTAAWSRCWSSTRRSTPSSCARARWSSSSSSPAPSERCASWACRSSSRARPASTTRLPGPGARRAHRGGAARGRLRRGAIAELLESGAVAGPAGAAKQDSFMA